MPFTQTRKRPRASPGSRLHRKGVITNVNVNDIERWASVVGGGALALYGFTRSSLRGVALALIGGGLVVRGVTGHCDVYGILGLSTAHIGRRKVRTRRAIKVKTSVTVNRSPEELYRFWRNFENLPRIMNHLQSVTVTSDTLSHWVAKAPLGTTVEWDAEIINEKENELIGWRSLEGADVDNAGSVRFLPSSSGRTEVRVTLQYDPPGGPIGATIAKLFGEAPEQQIQGDLRRFKRVMETREIPVSKGR